MEAAAPAIEAPNLKNGNFDENIEHHASGVAPRPPVSGAERRMRKSLITHPTKCVSVIDQYAFKIL